MDLTTLEKANDLNRKIKQFNNALDCFQWEAEYGGGTTNPQIIIEFDGCDGREQQPIPMFLSDEMLGFLKESIIKGRKNALDEFNSL